MSTDEFGSVSTGVPALTPSKQRYDLGAASSYYFKYVNSSSKKSTKKKDQSFASSMNDVDNDDTADSSAMVGLDSILGLSSDGDSHDSAGRERSMISQGANSKSSGVSSDDNNLMNKSTLSDTTELSAANFVLTATSRQRLNLKHLAGVAKKSRQDHERANVNDGSNIQLAQHFPSLDKENVINLSYELQNKEQQLLKQSPHDGLHYKDTPSHMGSPTASLSMFLTQKSPSPSSLRKPNDTLKSSVSKSPMKMSDEPWSAKRFSQDSSEKAHPSPSAGASPSLDIASNEKESRDTRRTSLASTGSGGGPSPHSTTTNDDSIASLGDFDDLFRDIIDDTIDTHSHRRRSRRQSSLQARKSSVDRLMNFDTDLSDASPASPSLKAPKRYSSIAPSSSNRDIAPKATTLMDEIPSPPSTPRIKSPSLFRLTPSSHQKPTPTKLQPTPQRVLNSEAIAGSTSGSSPPFATGNSTEHHEDVSPGIASHLDESTSVSLQSISNKTKSPNTPEPVDQAESLRAHSGTPPECMDERDKASSPLHSIPHPSIRLTPNSHKKPTPTKLTKSPRRIANPNALDSPARNTRRARNSICPMASLENETGTSIFSPISRGVVDSASPNSTPVFAQRSASGHLSPALGASPKDDEKESQVQHSSPRQSEKKTQDQQHYRSTPDKAEKSLQSPGTTESYTGTGLSELLGVSRGWEETFEQGTITTPTKRDMYSIQIRLTPNSHVKPTPTKLKPSPRRIPNPMALIQRSSRRSGKASRRQSSGDTASVGVFVELLGEGSASKRKRGEDTASLETQHDVFELKGSFENQGLSPQKRRKSSFGKFGSGKADRIENRQHESPALKMKGPPVSILSSRKRRSRESGGPKVSQRLVAFGSPEAAEYHVGSPSFSLTPMPRGKARAMFAVPRDKMHTIELPRRLDSLNASKNGVTVEIEADLNALVNNMQGSANLSPIANVTEREATETFDMEGSGGMFSQTNSGESNIGDRAREVSGQNGDETVPLEGEIEKVIAHSAKYPEIDRDSYKGSRYPQKAASPFFSSQETKSEMDFGSPSLHEESRDAFDSPNSNISGRFNENVLNVHEGEMTVELEPNVNALLQATQLGNSVVAPLHSPMDCTNESCSPAESIDLTDAHSIASMSMNSRTVEAPTGISPPIGAQKLDFRLHPSDRSDDSMEVEFTVELENDMTSLIAVARAAKAGASNIREDEPPLTQMTISSGTDDENDFENSSCSSRDNMMSPHESSPDLQLEDETTSKRLGISIRSLSDSNIGSLMRSPASTTQASLKSPMEEMSQHNSSLASTMSSHSISVYNRSSSTVEAKMKSVEMVTLNSNEILEVAGVGVVYSRMPLGADVLDPLLQISNSAREINNVALLASINQFITAVCGEVESQTEADADAASYLASVVDKDPRHLVALQRSLRSSENGETRQEFIKMADAVKEYVESDWNNWFSNVLGSLQKTVDGSSKSLNVDFGSFDSISASHSETDKYLATLTEKSIRSLRWKAMFRQKEALSKLEAEVTEMDAQLEKSKQFLADEQTKARELECQIRHRKQLNAVKEEYQAQRPLAQSSQKNMVILKGLHTWKPLSLEESALSFGFICPSVTSAIKMSFDLSETGTVGCTTCIIPLQVHHSHRIDRKYHSTVTAFIDAATKKLLGSGSLLSSQKIGLEVQQLELDLGRLAQVANEFESLRRRYNARLCNRGEGTTPFYLTIGFSNQQKKVRATFDVLESYPMTLLPFTIDVIEGEVDVNALQKMIARNVKPGFWSLSRSCDTVLAFLRERES